MGRTTGGPLLSVADLMQDLSEEPPSVQALASPSHDHFSTPSSSGLEAFVPRSESLDDAFERTYKELDLALASSGHSWTSLTQQLYSALTTANQVVAVVSLNLKFLAEKVTSLKSALERGDAVMGDLQAAAAQLQGNRM